MNALAHAVEALYAPEATPHPPDADDRLGRVAEEAITALSHGLPRAVAQPDDLDARTETLYGAWLAGWSLGSATMGLHHKLAHVLGGTYRLPHAGVHSALLPQVAAFNADAGGARAADDPAAGFERAARALGVAGPDRVGTALFDLAASLGAPTSLAELGFAEEGIEVVAAEVARADATNPRSFTEADLVRLLRDAHEGRHP
jgi:maleylacetate reductase